MAVGDPVIHRQPPAGTAGVHALLVGVGNYADPAIPRLASAPASALAFADWLHTKQAMPQAELGSIALLASSPSGAPLSWQGQALAAPTRQNLQAAVDSWLVRAGSDPENVAVFYFCGHGVELGGGMQSLLLEDVNLASPADPFANALAFNDFLAGMESCGARKQVYVLDACRELPPGLDKWSTGVQPGSPFVRFNPIARHKQQPRKCPVLQAAAASQKAWQGTQLGWFTEMLLAVLEGAAGSNRFSAQPNQYPVNTRDITATIDYLVKHDYLSSPVGPQSPRRAGDDDFDLHLPDPPVVPVVVTAAAPQPFDACSQGVVVQSQLLPPWRPLLAVGKYDFVYGSTTHHAEITVPARKVHLP